MRRRSARSRSTGSTPTPGGPSSGPASRIAATTRRWLAALPAAPRGGGLHLVHGSPRDPTWEYVTVAPVARASLALSGRSDASYGLLRPHPPARRRSARRRPDARSLAPARRHHGLALDERPGLLNPGSVGQPRDGDPDAPATSSSTPSAATADLAAGPVRHRRGPARDAAGRPARAPRRPPRLRAVIV